MRMQNRMFVGLLTAVLLLAVPAMADGEATIAPASEWTKPVPLTFSLDYTLVSDYIFRGVNFSEFSGEGHERLNHQLSAGIEADLGDFGAVGFCAWFEWFEGQENKNFDPAAHGKLQEVDYAFYWSYDIPSTPVSIETGWIAYSFPQAKGDAHITNEWYISLGVDDSFLFGTESSVLNPYVAYYLDTDDVKGCWIEMGISHDFALSEMGMKSVPGLKDMTLTPSFVLGIDKGQFDEGSHLHNLLYGLDVGYDLSSALNIPAQYGSLSLTGFLRFSQAINTDVISDEFFGGVSIGYEW